MNKINGNFFGSDFSKIYGNFSVKINENLVSVEITEKISIKMTENF